jgi:hypothetical protein
LARAAAAKGATPVSPSAPRVVEPAKPIRWWQRARSAVLLTVLSVVLGVLVAVVVGAVVVTTVLLIKHALG